MALQVYPNDSKTFQVEAGPKYAYIYHDAKEGKPTFLLLHGFPSSSYDWRYQISDLTKAGYGVLAPDLLGYGDTDKPEAMEEYSFGPQSAHLAAILDHEGLKRVIAVGHDWGAGLLGRFVNYQQQYVSAAIFMSVQYSPPRDFDLDALNQITEKAFGYPCLGYQYFFNEPTAAKAIEENHESFLSLLYPADPELWKTDVGPLGKAKAWVTSGKTGPLPSWLPKEEQDIHSKIMLAGGYTGPTNWYKSMIANTDAPNRAKIPPENLVLNFPVVFIQGKLDFVCRFEAALSLAEQGKKGGWLKDIEVKLLDTGHWIQLEKPKEVYDIFDTVAKKIQG